MDFTIYTLSPPSFLEAALNGLAIFTAGGDFKTMIMIGLLIGVLFTYFKSIFNGADKIGVGEIFVAFLIYMIAFAPTARVTIESIKDGEVRVVDNVPLGVAVTGSIISSIGKGTLTIMQDAYDPVDRMGNFSYVEPLRVLQVARQGTGTTKFWDSLNAYARSAGYSNADMRKSFVDYVADCTTTALQLDPGTPGYKRPTEISNSPVDEALKFESEVYYTRTTLYGDDRDYMTCSSAFDTLWGIIRGGMDAAPAPGVNNPATYLSNLASDVLLKEVTDYPQTLSEVIQGFGWSYDDARYFMINNALKPVLADGFNAEFNYSGNTNAAIMLSTALSQRDTQWAAEYSMFTESMDAIIAFVETFLYAVTPILAFLMVMGGFGMKLAPKYMLMAFWVWLWYPILGIVNLYLTNSVSESLSHIGPNLSSFYASQELDEQIQHWIAVAGLMGAITPILALTILTGSAYAMTTLAQRLGGRDHVDEKQVSPDVRTPAPAMALAPSYTHTPFSTQMSGASTPTMDWSSTSSSIYQHAHQRSVQAQQNWSSALGHTVNSAVQSQDMIQRLESLGHITSSGHGQAVEAVNNITAGLAKQFKIDSSHQDALKGAVSAALSGQLGIPKLASIMGDLSGEQAGTITASKVASALDDLKRSAGFTDKTSAQLQHQLQAQMADSRNKADLKTFAQGDTETLQKASTEAKNWSEIENSAYSVAQNSGSSQSIPLDQLAQAALNNPNAKKGLDEYYQNGVSENEKKLLDQSIATYSKTHGPAVGRYMAIMRHAANRATNGDTKAIRALTPALAAYGYVSPGQEGVGTETSGANVVQDVASHAPGKVQNKVDSAVQSPINLTDPDRPQGPPSYSDAARQVEQDYGGHKAHVKKDGQSRIGAFTGKNYQEAMDYFTKAGSGDRKPLYAPSLAIQGMTKLSGQEVSEAARAAWGAAVGMAHDLYEAGRNWANMSPEQRHEALEDYRRTHKNLEPSVWEKAKDILLGRFAQTAETVRQVSDLVDAFKSGDMNRIQEGISRFMSRSDMSLEEKGQALQAAMAAAGGTPDRLKMAQEAYQASMNSFMYQAADAFQQRGFTPAQAEYMAARMYATDPRQIEEARARAEEEFRNQNGPAGEIALDGYMKTMDRAVAEGGMNVDTTASNKYGQVIQQYNTFKMKP